MENKIIFAGPVGAGKTTAIRSISDIMVVDTEARASDHVVERKELTTVAMDYGILHLDEGARVHIYGTPGQNRFDFMWEILSEGAMGLVILIDSTRPDPVADLEFYLRAFSKPIADSNHVVAIAVTRTDCGVHPALLSRFRNTLAEMRISAPVFEVDARQREDVKQVLFALLAMLDSAVCWSKAA